MNMQKNNEVLRNRIAGAVFGFAVGDAMGATTEFMTKKQIKKVYGKVTDIIGGGWLNLKPGEVTDDTQMTLCIMDALIYSNNYSGIKFANQTVQNFIRWYQSGPKDIGGQCRRAITRLLPYKGKFISCSDAIMPFDKDALGNGSLMRALPCALLNKSGWNIFQGQITHNNHICNLVIQEYTRLIQDYLKGNLYTGYVKSPLEPTGYIKNTFNNAVYWSCLDSFENAIFGAVNYGGDADTIAAIAGSMAGARFGYDAIPKEWIEKLNPQVVKFLKKFIHFVFSCLQI